MARLRLSDCTWDQIKTIHFFPGPCAYSYGSCRDPEMALSFVISRYTHPALSVHNAIATHMRFGSFVRVLEHAFSFSLINLNKCMHLMGNCFISEIEEIFYYNCFKVTSDFNGFMHKFVQA